MPAVTEMLYAIGAGPRMVGVSSFDIYPPEVRALPKVGGLIDPDLERIISLRPDLVVVSETHTDLRAQLEGAGITMFPHALGNLDNVTRTIRALGTATGLDSRGRPSSQRRSSRASRPFGGGSAAGRRPATLLVFSRAPGALRDVFVSGGIGFLHDLLELAGGANVFGGIQARGGAGNHRGDPLRGPCRHRRAQDGPALAPPRSSANGGLERAVGRTCRAVGPRLRAGRR